jgi:uncharacterized small protein (TIGR04563 family)
MMNVNKSERTAPRPNKQCISFPAPMLREIEKEAIRLDRSVSWVVQRAWKISRDELKKLQSD